MAELKINDRILGSGILTFSLLSCVLWTIAFSPFFFVIVLFVRL